MKITNEPEFEQAYNELLITLKDSTLFEKRPELRRAVDVIAEPERVVSFRVPWEDDKGNLHVNRGYRVQFNSALGPYKGGLRFHRTVDLSILKFLGFEQTFKNALTGLSMGGGKGGSDFDPKGRTHSEIRRFCQSFMTELRRHIGPDTDVPAGDINVTGLEVGYLFGQYKRLQNRWEGTITGKGLTWGGSLIRPEATGYGVIYYLEKMIEVASKGSESMKGKSVLISGSGNVAQYAALKAIELGATVLSLSDSQGTFLCKNGKGFTAKQVERVMDVKGARQSLDVLKTELSDFEYHEGKRPWTLVDKVDIALPCATQNEVSGAEAEHLIKAGCRFVAEGSNMGSTIEAIGVYEKSRSHSGSKGLWYGPAKAANCGGVAVSGLEMAQNSSRETWTAEEVDRRLKDIMVTCFNTCYDTSKEYATKPEDLPSLVRGGNIAGFVKVVDAMIAQGDFY